MMIAILQQSHAILKLDVGWKEMSSEDKALARPPGLGVAPAQAEHSMELAKADATAGKDEVAKVPGVFPRRRPDVTDAQAERSEALRAHPPPESANGEHVSKDI
jgi:hypothetical protein